MPAKLITTTEGLAAACERMASHAFVTVDTEFLREFDLLSPALRRSNG